MLDGVQDPEGLLPPSPGVPDPIPIVPWDEEDDDLGDYGDRGGDLLEQYGQHADGGEEEEEAGKPKPLLPPRELLGKIWFLLAFNVGASHVCWPVQHLVFPVFPRL